MANKESSNVFLKEFWNSTQIRRGDSILFHANATRLIKNCLKKDKAFKIKTIIKTLLEKLGPNGTLIVPTFSFKSIKSKFFDIKNTPSEMGMISEIIRKHPNSIRTGHPVYSFAVLGKKKFFFKNMNNFDAFSSKSPFQKIYDYNFKIAIMDLPDSKSMTFYHFIEQINKIDYRFIKEFSVKYKNHKGLIKKKKYKIFVRDIKKKVITEVDRAGKHLWKKKIFTGDMPGEKTGVRLAWAKDIFDCITDIIKKNKADKYLYKIKN